MIQSNRKQPLCVTILSVWAVLILLLGGCRQAIDEWSSVTTVPTPSPTLVPQLTPEPPSATLSPAQLKYLLIEKFGGMGASGGIFYCDPDLYPVGRGDVGELALQHFADIQKNAEEFQAILEHNNLARMPNLSSEQKLLIYQEHKQLSALNLKPDGEIYAFQFQVLEAPGSCFAIEGNITPSGAITIEKKEPGVSCMCPICLAGKTRIATPQGQIAVQDLRPGMVVWTLDGSGARVPAAIIKTGRVGVPAGHSMVRLRLDDGRELLASPGHPTADGRPLGDLLPGNGLDGAQVVSVERMPYEETATYDILPAGETGFYWADGILVGSTLAESEPGLR